MNKKLIRLTESDLHRIVKESVNRILRENKTDNFGKVFNEISGSDVGGDETLFKMFSGLYPDLSMLFEQLGLFFKKIKAYDYFVTIGQPFSNGDFNEFLVNTPYLDFGVSSTEKYNIIQQLSSIVERYGKGACKFRPYSNADICLLLPSTVIERD